MPKILIPDITIRTTSDGVGHPHGITFGAGGTYNDAMIGLNQDAARMARETAEPFEAAKGEHAGRPDAVWRFEVVDVRLQPGPDDNGEPSWVAYGTLVSEGADPWASSFWDQRH